jgi:hypothetical protein
VPSFGVFDRAEVGGMAEANIERNGLADRIKFYSGNFFEEIQSGFDVIVMKHIIHDWSDERCIVILKNCRKVLKVGDRLIVVDHLVDNSDENYSSVLALDHSMAMQVGGKERTLEEFRGLFDLTGFEIVEIRRALYERVIETRVI